MSVGNSLQTAANQMNQTHHHDVAGFLLYYFSPSNK